MMLPPGSGLVAAVTPAAPHGGAVRKHGMAVDALEDDRPIGDDRHRDRRRWEIS